MLINQDFTHNRSHFLGGSDIGALIGVSPYRSPLDVWLEKTGKNPGHKDSMALRFGSFAESFVADEYALATGESLVSHPDGLIHPQHSFCVGHIDRFVLTNKDQPLFHENGMLNAKKILECKTASSHSQHHWGEPRSDSIPLPYLCQCIWYLGITGLSQIDVAVLIGGSDLRIYTVHRDLELETLLFEKAAHFWSEHVLKDSPPKPQSIGDCQMLYRKASANKTIAADSHTLELIRSLKTHELQLQQMEEVMNQTKQELMEKMGDAEILTHQGVTLVSWKAPKPGYRIDTKRLTQDYPDLVKKYQSPIQNSRRLIVKDITLEPDQIRQYSKSPSDVLDIGIAK